jgi:DNA repair photolyase
MITNKEALIDDLHKCFSNLTHETAFYVGQCQDSFGFSQTNPLIKSLVLLFAQEPLARLVLMTKAADVEILSDLGHRGHTAIVWSLNPQIIASQFEHGTPEISERLSAALQCKKLGYHVRFQFSPIVPIGNWETIYQKTIEDTFEMVIPDRITLATLSCFPEVLQLLRNGTNSDKKAAMLFEGQEIDSDNRYRLPVGLRIHVYKFILDTIKKQAPGLNVAICLETSEVHQELGTSPDRKCNCIW